jgi:hypothetical protein
MPGLLLRSTVTDAYGAEAVRKCSRYTIHLLRRWRIRRKNIRKHPDSPSLVTFVLVPDLFLAARTVSILDSYLLFLVLMVSVREMCLNGRVTILPSDAL